jgi:hypothetical protein
MSDVLVKDILLKAAEDVQSGMWCQGRWFIDEDGKGYSDGDLMIFGGLTMEKALKSHRCAEGSIALSTQLLGGVVYDYEAALAEVGKTLEARPYPPTTACAFDNDHSHQSIRLLSHFNDIHLPGDPFEAGQILAELFRSTAEAL